MKKEYLETIKKDYSWFYNEEMNLTLSDDLDSFLATSLLLQYNPKWQVTQFYSYDKGLYCKEGFKQDADKQIGIDISLVKGKCISNHMSVLNSSDAINKEDLNMNIINNVYANNYFVKYNLSTFLLVAGILKHKFDSDKARRLSLVADSSFLPFFYGNRTFEEVQKKYLFDLGLADVWESQHDMTKQKFYDGQDYLNAKAKLFVNSKGKLQFNKNIPIKVILETLGIKYDPSILEGFFTLQEHHKGFRVGKNSIKSKDDMYAFTVINRNEVKFMKKVS